MRHRLLMVTPQRASQARKRLPASSTVARFAVANHCHQWTPQERAGVAHASPLPMHTGRSASLVTGSAQSHGFRAPAEAPVPSGVCDLLGRRWQRRRLPRLFAYPRDRMVRSQRPQQPLAISALEFYFGSLLNLWPPGSMTTNAFFNSSSGYMFNTRSSSSWTAC